MNFKSLPLLLIPVAVLMTLAGCGPNTSPEGTGAAPEPQPTVTVTSTPPASTKPSEACMDALARSDELLKLSAEGYAFFGDHLQDDQNLFNNLTEEGFTIFTEEMLDTSTNLQNLQGKIKDKRAEYDKAVALCKAGA